MPVQVFGIQENTQDLCIENDLARMKTLLFFRRKSNTGDVTPSDDVTKISDDVTSGKAIEKMTDSTKHFFLTSLMRQLVDHDVQIVTFQPDTVKTTEKTTFLANNLGLVVDLRGFSELGRPLDTFDVHSRQLSTDSKVKSPLP